MTAKADLLRALKDRQRSEEVVRAECLGIARKRKMSTEAIARVGVELGIAFRPSSPGKPTTVEEAVSTLVRIHFDGLERVSSETNEEKLGEAAANYENTVSTVRTTDTNAHFYDGKSGAGKKLKEASSANVVCDSPDHDPQLDKPGQSVERTTTTDSTLSLRDIHRKTPSQAQPAARNKVDDLKEIIQELRASFTEFRAEAKDREAKYLTKIRLLTEKVSSLELTMSSIEKHATEREEKVTRKLSSLAAKVGDLNIHAKAVHTRMATTGTPTHDKIDHDPPTPPMTNNSTAVAVGEPNPKDNKEGQQDWADVVRRHTELDIAKTKITACPPKAPMANHPPSNTNDEDDDELWTLVAGSKPTGKKAVVYVGNLKIGAKEDEVREFIQKRCAKLRLRPPKIYNSKMFEKEPEEGEIIEFSCARLTIDYGSLESICDRQFWPGRTYARP